MGYVFPLMGEPAREEEKKAHSSKPNEKLGKIAFRLPSSDFRHTAARLQCVERWYRSSIAFRSKYEPQPMRTKLKRQNIQ